MLGPRNRAKFWEEHATQTHVTQTATWNLPHTGTNTLQTRQPASPGPWAPRFRSLLTQRNGRLPPYAGGKRKAIDFVWENFMLVFFIISRRVMKSSKAKSITAMLREGRAALWLVSNRLVSR